MADVNTTRSEQEKRTTLRDLRRWAQEGKPFPVLTCYDATTARWLWRGGVRSLLVGDTAAQMVLGYDSTLPAKMPFMLEITAAVRRGAPNAFVIADMPFGSYQASDKEAIDNASAFIADAGADIVKLEVDSSFAPLIEKMVHAGIPVMPHIGSRPQHVRAEGGFFSAGNTKEKAQKLFETASALVSAGAQSLLVEAVPDQVGQQIVDIATAPGNENQVPVIGCGAGPACHGHVVVLHDLLKLSDWQPPFVTPVANIGEQIKEAATDWRNLVQNGQYLKDGGPYKMK